MKLTCLTRYDAVGASSRVRFLQYFKMLEGLIPGIQIACQPLLDAAYLRRKYAGRSTLGAAAGCYFRRFVSNELWGDADVWWVEKELWPWVPAFVESLWLSRRRYVIDIDDAIFHNYDHHPSGLIRSLYGRKIDRVLARADLVTAGNEYLAQRARAAGARWVEVLPSVVDTDSYRCRLKDAMGDSARERVVTIGWIGTPATVQYMDQLIGPLQRLARKHAFKVVIIGGGRIDMPGVDVVAVDWSAEMEAELLATCDIGVMPLDDSPWEKGKCGYKLIQYMACGLPIVASPVGVNESIVRDGVNGFLASGADGWHDALERLIVDEPLRNALGRAGRERIESEYAVQVMAPRVAGWLSRLAKSAQPVPHGV